jgi:hypothetical protein
VPCVSGTESTQTAPQVGHYLPEPQRPGVSDYIIGTGDDARPAADYLELDYNQRADIDHRLTAFNHPLDEYYDERKNLVKLLHFFNATVSRHLINVACAPLENPDVWYRNLRDRMAGFALLINNRRRRRRRHRRRRRRRGVVAGSQSVS